MRTFRFIAVLAAAVLLPLAAQPPQVQAQAQLLPVRLAGVPTDDLTPVVYAIKNGLYKKAGLDVSFVPTSSGSTATTAVVAGTYELGKGSAVASMVAHLKDLPLVVVANGAVWDSSVPFNELLVASDTGLKTGADFNGKTIGVPALNDLNTLVVSAWVDQNGGDSKTLKFVEIPNSVAPAALKSHRVDADALQEPQLAEALAGGGVKALTEPYNAISKHFVFAVYFANKAFATAHPQAVRDWARITYEAAAYTNTHHAETEAMMADFTKVPKETIHSMARVDGATNGDAALLQPFIDVAAKYKMIAKAFPAKEMFF